MKTLQSAALTEDKPQSRLWSFHFVIHISPRRRGQHLSQGHFLYVINLEYIQSVLCHSSLGGELGGFLALGGSEQLCCDLEEATWKQLTHNMQLTYSNVIKQENTRWISEMTWDNWTQIPANHAVFHNFMYFSQQVSIGQICVYEWTQGHISVQHN